MKLLRIAFIAVVLSCFTGIPYFKSIAQTPENALVYPGDSWETLTDPEASGWSEADLQKAAAFASTLNTAGYIVIHKGKIVQEWGDTQRNYKCHSVRKSFLSALYGIHVDQGNIDLNATLADLKIDDNPPSLTDEEKQATVEMLLKARSGVYHPALYETKSMAAKRPKRHSHAPGTFWYYNNWDFNALGSIFEQTIGSSIFEEYNRLIAGPIDMENFDPERDTEYYTGEASEHPAYLFEMNARDMARFGLLFARNGKWKNKQIIPASWVKASTTSYSDAGPKGGYGYLWWIAQEGKHFGGDIQAPEGLYTARGKGGQVIAVIPDMDFVLVHRVNTFKRGNSVSYHDVGQLLIKVLDAYKGT